MLKDHIFFKRNLKQKQYCGCLKSRNVQYPHLGRVSSTRSGAAARWSSVLLDLEVVAKCTVGAKASNLATESEAGAGVSPPLPEIQATTGPAQGNRLPCS